MYSKLKIPFFLTLLLIILGSCKQKETKEKSHDVSALTTEEKLNNTIMTAMGGQEEWDNLTNVSWTFFGARHLVWDKVNGRVRIDSPRDTSVFLVNLNSNEGKVMRKGKEVTDPEKLTEEIQKGKNMWINDAYWLFMPFKLNDPGVKLKHLGQDTMQNGRNSEVLELTFDNVGNTPQNKYKVYIDKEDNLIKQWAFYKEASQDTASRIWPWDNYQSHNGLLLSSDRSDKSGPSNVRVHETLDDEVFTSFERFDYF